MNKSIKFLLGAIIAVISFARLDAQNYVVDELFGDSVIVSQISLNDDKTAESPGEIAFYLQPGDTVTVTRILEGNSYPAITVKGKSGGNGGGQSSGTQHAWIDQDGGRHTNQVDADEANKRIAERKANS